MQMGYDEDEFRKKLMKTYSVNKEQEEPKEEKNDFIVGKWILNFPDKGFIL
jgi:hypothetical protein